MRPWSLSVALAATLFASPAGCRGEDAAPPPPPAEDRGGATGKPRWGIGFGGLGTDAPRAVATGPDGDVYVAGYFDGEIDFGAAGKRAAAAKAAAPDPAGKAGKTSKPNQPASDAFVVKIIGDGKI